MAQVSIRTQDLRAVAVALDDALDTANEKVEEWRGKGEEEVAQLYEERAEHLQTALNAVYNELAKVEE